MGSNAFPLFTNNSGNNQFGNYGTGMPGVVPAAPGGGGSPLDVKGATAGGFYKGPNGLTSEAPIAPNLTTDFFNFLKSNIGDGATPFNLSTALPSGGVTAPGQLSAPINPVLQQIADFYGGKETSLPGVNSMQELSKTGAPVDQTPAWQAMIEAQQRNIKQNEAGMREQFAGLGLLKGSPFGQAEADYRMQTSKDQNAALLQATAQAQEQAAGRRLSASGALMEGPKGAQSVGELLQNFDQQSIDRLLQEFIRTRPEYSPYLNLLYGAATTFAPVQQPGKGGGVLGGIAGAIGTGLGSLLGPVGAAAGGAIGSALGKKAGG